MNRLFRNEGDILGVQSPFIYRFMRRTVSVYKKNSIPDKLPGIEFFIIKRSCEEGHSSIVLSNAPFPRERSGGDFPKLVLSFLRGDGHLLWFFFCFLVFGKGRRFKTHEYSKTHEKAVVIPCLKPEVRSRVITYLLTISIKRSIEYAPG